jgi:tetratricopeptide (TPR) repeat protein
VGTKAIIALPLVLAACGGPAKAVATNQGSPVEAASPGGDGAGTGQSGAAGDRAGTGDLNAEIRRIEALLDEKRYAEAYAAARNAAANNPKDARVHIFHGRSAFYAQKDAEAAHALDRALELDPGSAAAHFYRGVVAMYAHQDKLAEAHYAHAARLEPTNARYWFELGTERERMNQDAAALDAHTRCLQNHPETKLEAQAQFAIGSIEYERGHYDIGVRAWTRVLELDPSYVDAYFNLGQHHQLRGDARKAHEYFSEALKRAPRDAKILAKVIQAHYRLGELEQASPVRKQLLEVIATSKEPETRAMKEFCFDQFTDGDDRIYAYESIQKKGELVYWYTFRVERKGKLIKTIQLERSDVLDEMGVAFVLGADEAGVHHTFGVAFKKLPAYADLKELVLKAHHGKLSSGAASRPGTRR